MIRVTAPGRGGIIGNPSDIYGGTVVSCTIGERADVTVSASPKLILDVYGHFEVIDSDDKLEYDPELHFLDVAKAVWRYLRQSRFVAEGRLDPAATFHVRASSNIRSEKLTPGSDARSTPSDGAKAWSGPDRSGRLARATTTNCAR